MLEKMAATNHLTITEVVRLFFVEALPEPEQKLGTFERLPPRPRRFDCQKKVPPSQAF